MIRIGLTGSIGMGKSETARMFAGCGAPLWDSDAAVHALYEPGGAGVAAVAGDFPHVVKAGRVDRNALAAHVLGNRDALRRLEAVVHPLVAAGQIAFMAAARERNARAVVLDIPLLFETGAVRRLDIIVVVSAPAEIQRARVLSRPGMTQDKFEAILSKQTPDPIKRMGADFVVDTGQGLDYARHAVQVIWDRVCTSELERGDQNA